MENKTITFKTVDPFFPKERDGIKNNTVRFFDRGFSGQFIDEREKIMKYWLKKPFELYIKILNPNTQESFTRKIRDITVFECKGKRFDRIYIITWEHEEESGWGCQALSEED